MGIDADFGGKLWGVHIQADQLKRNSLVRSSLTVSWSLAAFSNSDIPAILLYSAPAFAYLTGMDYSQIITMEPGKRSGKPCIRGLRMTVADVLGYLASGMTHEEILRDFPYLTERDILASLAFAADRERKLETVAG
jgi:uncharacterized protein (DUF433 family)